MRDGGGAVQVRLAVTAAAFAYCHLPPLGRLHRLWRTSNPSAAAALLAGLPAGALRDGLPAISPAHFKRDVRAMLNSHNKAVGSLRTLPLASMHAVQQGGEVRIAAVSGPPCPPCDSPPAADDPRAQPLVRAARFRTRGLCSHAMRRQGGCGLVGIVLRAGAALGPSGVCSVPVRRHLSPRAPAPRTVLPVPRRAGTGGRECRCASGKV